MARDEEQHGRGGTTLVVFAATGSVWMEKTRKSRVCLHGVCLKIGDWCGWHGSRSGGCKRLRE